MIEKYDNFFTPTIQGQLFNTIIHSNFKIGWDDSDEVQHRMYPCLHSPYTFEDLKNITITIDYNEDKDEFLLG